MKSFVVEETFTEFLKSVNGGDFVHVNFLPAINSLYEYGTDLFFREELNVLSDNYPTLNNFSIESFGIDSVSGKSVVCLLVKNTRDEILEFYEPQRTLSKEESSTRVFNAALQTFVNTEIAVKSMFFALKDAKQRQRNDLYNRYVEKMTKLLKINCYSDFISSLER